MDQPNSEPDCSVTDDGAKIVAMHLDYPTDNVPHTVLADELTPAEHPAPGVTLQTLDGAIIGNAIIVKQTPIRDLPPTMQNTVCWNVQTDFGNKLILTESELFQMFKLGYQQEYDSWWDRRLELIKRSVEP